MSSILDLSSEDINQSGKTMTNQSKIILVCVFAILGATLVISAIALIRIEGLDSSQCERWNQTAAIDQKLNSYQANTQALVDNFEGVSQPIGEIKASHQALVNDLATFKNSTDTSQIRQKELLEYILAQVKQLQKTSVSKETGSETGSNASPFSCLTRKNLKKSRPEITHNFRMRSAYNEMQYLLSSHNDYSSEGARQFINNYTQIFPKNHIIYVSQDIQLLLLTAHLAPQTMCVYTADAMTQSYFVENLILSDLIDKVKFLPTPDSIEQLITSKRSLLIVQEMTPVHQLSRLSFKRLDVLVHIKYPQSVTNPYQGMRLVSIKRIKETNQCDSRHLERVVEEMSQQTVKIEAGWYHFQYKPKDHTRSTTQQVSHSPPACNFEAFKTYQCILFTPIHPVNRVLVDTPYSGLKIWHQIGSEPLTKHYAEMTLLLTLPQFHIHGPVWIKDFPYYAVLLLVAGTSNEVQFVLSNTYPEKHMLIASLVVNGLRDRVLSEEEYGLAVDHKWVASLVSSSQDVSLEKASNIVLNVERKDEVSQQRHKVTHLIQKNCVLELKEAKRQVLTAGMYLIQRQRDCA